MAYMISSWATRVQASKRSEEGVVKHLTQGSVKTKHMGKSLRIKIGNKTILANFDNLSPSNLVTRA
jgi:hypothetical protein